MASYQSLDDDNDDTHNYCSFIDDNIQLNNNFNSIINNIIDINITISPFEINDIIKENISNYIKEVDINEAITDKFLIDKMIYDDVNISIKGNIKDTADLKKYYNKLVTETMNNSTILNDKILQIKEKKKSLSRFLNNFSLSQDNKEYIIELIESELEKLSIEIKTLTKEYVIKKCKVVYINSLFKKENKKYMCNICLSNVESLYTFDNCGHCFCCNCINHPSITLSNRCPICRQTYARKIKLFL